MKKTIIILALAIMPGQAQAMEQTLIAQAATKPLAWELSTNPPQTHIIIQDAHFEPGTNPREYEILLAACKLGYLDNDNLKTAYKKAGKLSDNRLLTIGGCTEMKGAK